MQLRSQSFVSGTGIVLWSDANQVDAATVAHPEVSRWCR